MKTMTLAALLSVACAPLPSTPAASSTPPGAATAPHVEVSTSARQGIRLVPAKDGGMTCLSAKDVQRLQVYLDRCVPLEAP